MDYLKRLFRTNGREPVFLILKNTGERVDFLGHARAMGERNLPTTSATVPNEVEQAAIHQANEDHLEAARRAREARDHAVAEFDALQRSLSDRRDLDRVVERAEEKIEAELGSDRTVKERCQDLHRAHLALRRVKSELGLNREPRYPASRLLHFGLIAALLVLEAVVNAGFFSRLSADGFVGGLLIAVGVALINVGLGFLVGEHVLRHLHHPRHRRLAQIGLVFYGVCAIAINLAVAHLRAIALSSSMAPSETTGPFFESALLFALGVISSLIVAREAYLSDDPAPGYGRAHRRFVHAQRDYRSARDGLHARLLAHEQSIRDGFAVVLARLGRDLDQMVKMRLRVIQVHETYDADRVRHETTCTHALEAYRGVNKDVRETPEPPYFKDYPSLDNCLPDRRLLLDMETRIRVAMRRAEVLAREAAKIEAGGRTRIEALNQRFNEFVRDTELAIDLASEASGTFEFGPRSDR
jgi:hypothetical protein